MIYYLFPYDSETVDGLPRVQIFEDLELLNSLFSTQLSP